MSATSNVATSNRFGLLVSDIKSVLSATSNRSCPDIKIGLVCNIDVTSSCLQLQRLLLSAISNCSCPRNPKSNFALVREIKLLSCPLHQITLVRDVKSRSGLQYQIAVVCNIKSLLSVTSNVALFRNIKSLLSAKSNVALVLYIKSLLSTTSNPYCLHQITLVCNIKSLLTAILNRSCHEIKRRSCPRHQTSFLSAASVRNLRTYMDPIIVPQLIKSHRKAYNYRLY